LSACAEQRPHFNNSRQLNDSELMPTRSSIPSRLRRTSSLAPAESLSEGRVRT
jgi:hypothetical protein